MAELNAFLDLAATGWLLTLPMLAIFVVAAALRLRQLRRWEGDQLELLKRSEEESVLKRRTLEFAYVAAGAAPAAERDVYHHMPEVAPGGPEAAPRPPEPVPAPPVAPIPAAPAVGRSSTSVVLVPDEIEPDPLPAPGPGGAPTLLADQLHQFETIRQEILSGNRKVLESFENLLDSQAIQEAEAALADDPENFKLLDWLAFMYYTNDQVDRAIEAYKKLLSRQPDAVDLFFFLGNCFYKVNLLPEAQYCWRRTLALDPPEKTRLRTEQSLANAAELASQWERFGIHQPVTDRFVQYLIDEEAKGAPAPEPSPISASDASAEAPAEAPSGAPEGEPAPAEPGVPNLAAMAGETPAPELPPPAPEGVPPPVSEPASGPDPLPSPADPAHRDVSGPAEPVAIQPPEPSAEGDSSRPAAGPDPVPVGGWGELPPPSETTAAPSREEQELADVVAQAEAMVTVGPSRSTMRSPAPVRLEEVDALQSAFHELFPGDASVPARAAPPPPPVSGANDADHLESIAQVEGAWSGAAPARPELIDSRIPAVRIRTARALLASDPAMGTPLLESGDPELAFVATLQLLRHDAGAPPASVVLDRVAADPARAPFYLALLEGPTSESDLAGLLEALGARSGLPESEAAWSIALERLGSHDLGAGFELALEQGGPAGARAVSLRAGLGELAELLESFDADGIGRAFASARNLMQGAPRLPTSLVRALAQSGEGFATVLFEEAAASLADGLGLPGKPWDELVAPLPGSLRPAASLLAVLAQAGHAPWAGLEGSRRLALGAFLKLWDQAGETSLLAEAGDDPRALAALAATCPAFRLPGLAAQPAVDQALATDDPVLNPLRAQRWLTTPLATSAGIESAARLWRDAKPTTRILARLIRLWMGPAAPPWPPRPEPGMIDAALSAPGGWPVPGAAPPLTRELAEAAERLGRIDLVPALRASGLLGPELTPGLALWASRTEPAPASPEPVEPASAPVGAAPKEVAPPADPARPRAAPAAFPSLPVRVGATPRASYRWSRR